MINTFFVLISILSSKDCENTIIDMKQLLCCIQLLSFYVLSVLFKSSNLTCKSVESSKVNFVKCSLQQNVHDIVKSY